VLLCWVFILRAPMMSGVMLDVVMLSVATLNAVMLSVDIALLS
jgi:hypothetical protein